MTDKELMQALYAEGIEPKDIAAKFECTTRHVNKVLGLTGLDPRSVRVYQRFWDAFGAHPVGTSEIACRLGMPTANARVYLMRLEQLGHICRVGVKARRHVIWQMVKIDELLPRAA